MPARCTYDFALVRLVPRVERGEAMNAGVVLHCRELSYLGARLALDRDRLRALSPALSDEEIDSMEAALQGVAQVAAGDPAAGAVAALPAPERFHWLTAPRSTVVQTSPVHVGLVERTGSDGAPVDLTAVLDDLFARLVA